MTTVVAKTAQGAGGGPTPSRRRRAGNGRSAVEGSYALYLLPGALAFLVVIVVPFVMNTGISFTEWSGVGTPEFTGLDNYEKLVGDEDFWESFRHSLAMVVAMAGVIAGAWPEALARLRNEPLTPAQQAANTGVQWPRLWSAGHF